ncbi:MAG: tyrosine-type recombinase/integrase [Candidatus Hermodarchaeia archaeon]|jgi:site-specific recombinase XerD
MEQLDPVETWLANVAISNSDSKSTRDLYKSNLQRFCSFIGKTPKQILEDYNSSSERELRRRYAQYIQAFGAAQSKKKLTPCTIASRIGAVKSFFKYNDLPLAFIPAPRLRVTYHNRDITHEELRLILGASRPREKAFFAIMAQSGLRPDTICNLKYWNIKEDLIHNRIPCKIEIPEEIAKGKYHSYFTFIGEEAFKYLRAYLNIRPDIADEDYLFLKQGTKQKTSPKSISNLFARTVKKLRNKGLMEVKQKGRKKPRDVRLYNLRKWFRKHAHEAGFELVQFWMGHIVRAGQEEHYRPTDVEFHRKLYAEKAMPFLRLETATPTETEKVFTTLKQENRELRDQIENLETVMQKIYQKVFHEEIEQEKIDKLLEEDARSREQEIEKLETTLGKEEEYLAKHPEERKRLEEQEEKREAELMKYLEEHAEEIEEQEKWIEEQIIREDERRKTLGELQDIVKKAKEKKK